MSVYMTKPWRDLSPGALDALSGQLGVFEFGNAAGEIVYIGCADARSRFGLRSAAAEALLRCPSARAYRVEVTTAYRTRFLELLMAYRAERGGVPIYNEAVPGLGRLSPG